MTSDSSQRWQVPGSCWEDIQSFTMEWKHRAVTHSQTSAQASPCEAQGLLGVGTREAEHPGAFLEETTRQRNPAKQKLNENLQKKKGKLPKAFHSTGGHQIYLGRKRRPGVWGITMTVHDINITNNKNTI